MSPSTLRVMTMAVIGTALWGSQAAPSTAPPLYEDNLLKLKTSDLVRTDHFDTSGSGDPGWSTLSDNPEAGRRLVLLKLPASDDTRSGWWLLGRSHDPDIVAHCTRPETGGQALTGTPATIDGHPFTHLETSDAGMNHYRQVRVWRSVMGGSCLSIEHVVQGVNGEVFDPPRTPAFSIDEAMTALDSTNDALMFHDKD
ncbi:hypothetical protein SAMN05421848_0508 [Kushneria avicenniae]|uniref:Secreted protein n=1 Tax=Kushneria avicenniae TaxID=402385 RepID=A0A1I1GCH6_9GAMM|nr:hypothetical protein [Kushneria avicenniae]SFC09244.1 hypothetical protein SAMN05421848_0508 [Kushneria avicenniae]